jgi:hypothetical protein
MTKHLTSDVSSRDDLDGSVYHLEWREVLVLNKILQELTGRTVIALISWIRHASAISHQFLGGLALANDRLRHRN